MPISDDLPVPCVVLVEPCPTAFNNPSPVSTPVDLAVDTPETLSQAATVVYIPEAMTPPYFPDDDDCIDDLYTCRVGRAYIGVRDELELENIAKLVNHGATECIDHLEMLAQRVADFRAFLCRKMRGLDLTTQGQIKQELTEVANCINEFIDVAHARSKVVCPELGLYAD